MKILIGRQIKDADRRTMEVEPIESVQLMERASQAIANWITDNISRDEPLLFVVGKGNNGGDGLAVARILHHAGFRCSVYMVYDKNSLSNECYINYERLPRDITIIDNLESVEGRRFTFIDALLGTGLNGEVQEPISSLIDTINSMPNTVISIDLPSGMRSELGNDASQVIIRADMTLTLQFPKLAMLLPEAGEYAGDLVVLPIGLDQYFMDEANSPYYYITEKQIKDMTLTRHNFAHKGLYGHALLICGSAGMMGAAALATGAALRSGCGLVTLHLPYNERIAVQTLHPSAMLSYDEEDYFSALPGNLSGYNTIGIGCGLGRHKETVRVFEQLLKEAEVPMVLDADALNILADNNDFLKYIPANSILTPHPGELRRLIGDWENEEQKIDLSGGLASMLHSIVIVKGMHTMICMPDGRIYFNSTGNSGMAKGGSGDVLTGYITGLLARGYSPEDAAILGVYNHGQAGDLAASHYGIEGMNSRDIIDYLS